MVLLGKYGRDHGFLGLRRTSTLSFHYGQKIKLNLFAATRAGPNSDIDLLVEFFPDARPTLLDMAQIEIDLSEVLGGRKVDLRTAQDLSRYFRDEVVRTAEVQYVAG